MQLLYLCFCALLLLLFLTRSGLVHAHPTMSWTGPLFVKVAINETALCLFFLCPAVIHL
jgi:hypothetical protein